MGACGSASPTVLPFTAMFLLITLVAFLVAIGVLVSVHEWGHYRMAVACGVKVLRFSIGFGKPLLRFKPRRQHPGQDTEFVICLIPLGGYVKMLGEHEDEVPEAERHQAFNAQPLRSRALIAAAGPVANLVLAVLLYALVNWIGVQEPRAVLGPPAADSMAAKAGLQGGDLVRAAALAGDEFKPVRSFDSLNWLLARGAIDGQDLRLQLERSGESGLREVRLPLAALASQDPTPEMFRALGVAPRARARISEVTPGGPADRAGLRKDDVVLKVGPTEVADSAQLVDLIRASAAGGPPQPSLWEVQRAGRHVMLQVLPRVGEREGRRVGLVDVAIGAARPDMVLVRYGPVEGLTAGARKAWQVSALTLRVLGRMVVGQVSVKNLSSPVAIADYAGKSASMGLVYYLGFLAFFSLNLGLLNLLPIPVLDGGLLAYFLWEAVTGKRVQGAWLERLQYVGLSLLLAIMAIALYNDVASRLSL